VKYPRIWAEISTTQWAITPEALDGIFRAVEHGLTGDDRELFHRADTGAYDIFDGLAEDRKSFVSGDVGYLFVDGPIVSRATGFSNVSGLTSIQDLTSEYKALLADPRVERINMIVDSPGGSVKGVSDFAQLISESPKLVTAFNLGLMASAAYWISSGASRIYSVDTGEIGSIGVVARPAKRKDDVIVSSQSPDKWPDPSKPEGRAVVQTQIDDIASVMIDFIAQRRSVDPGQVVSSFGRGATMIASKALGANMIDGIQTLSDFVAGQIDNDKQASTVTLMEESGMTDLKKNPDPVEASVNVEAIKKEAAQSAVRAERERLKAIETIKDQFAGEDSRVYSAVSGVVDKAKFEDGSTADSIRALALQAAFDAQKNLIAEVQTPRRELAETLKSMPTSPLAKEDDSDKKRIDAMRRGFLGGNK